MLRIADRSSCAPRGLSIIEVLFSMGIIAVGLLGVLTILPVAGVRTTRGLIRDTADRMGRNAIRQFDVRGMARPNTWTRYSPSEQTYRAIPPWPSGHPIHSRSFCIDPLFVATHAARETEFAAIEYFPYYPPDHPDRDTRMQRISLQNFPGVDTGMSLAAAMEIFSSQDDLVFDLPDDPTFPPLQNFSDLQTRRQAMGRFSWLATLTPKQHLQAIWDDGATDYGDSYILSIVVFHDRDMSMNVEDPDPENTLWETYGPANERVLDVLIPHMGFAGGDVVLRTRPDRPLQDLDIRPGNWVMLSTRIPTTPEHLHFFRWYHVVGADGGVDLAPGGEEGEGPWERNVSLHGSDWDLFVGLVDEFPYANLRTQATVLNNVVAVYEKTVRLETSSLWTAR